MKITFRCDASPEIGSGHVRRCMALAGGLQQRGHEITFITSQKSLKTVPALGHSGYKISETITHSDILIIDHYGLDHVYEADARNFTGTVMVIDDLANRAHDCDILVDQTLGRKVEDYKQLTPENCKTHTGAEYAILRPQFAQLRQKAEDRRAQRAGRIKNILLFLSGTDPQGVSWRALEQLPESYAVTLISQEAREKTPDNVTILTNIEDMASLMLQADLAIGAGGTTSYERCCMGLPTCVLQIADNQADNIAALERAGAAIKTTIQNIAIDVTKLANSPERMQKMSKAAFQVCDGQGTEKLAQIIESAIRNE